MPKKKYQNISEQELILPGIGMVKSKAIIETEKEISNPNFVQIIKEKKKEEVKKLDNKLS